MAIYMSRVYLILVQPEQDGSLFSTGLRDPRHHVNCATALSVLDLYRINSVRLNKANIYILANLKVHNTTMMLLNRLWPMVDYSFVHAVLIALPYVLFLQVSL
jgi:hypothetical protein